MAASVGIAEPKDKTKYGYLSEYVSFGETEKEAGDYAEDIAAQMLASSLGISFDVNKSGMRRDNSGRYLVRYTRLETSPRVL